MRFIVFLFHLFCHFINESHYDQKNNYIHSFLVEPLLLFYNNDSYFISINHSFYDRLVLPIHYLNGFFRFFLYICFLNQFIIFFTKLKSITTSILEIRKTNRSSFFYNIHSILKFIFFLVYRIP